jgi:hypothetical protein
MSGEKAWDVMLSDMNNIQDKTKSLMQDTKAMVVALKQVGEAMMEELLQQWEQIRRIDKEAIRIGDNLNRANKLIKMFGKPLGSRFFTKLPVRILQLRLQKRER